MKSVSDKPRQPAKHKAVMQVDGSRQYIFYCDLSGIAVYKTGVIKADSGEEEIKRAWDEAKPYFNYCEQCGRNVSNFMFNVDMSKCVECAPWVCAPIYCTKCGKKISGSDRYCQSCGKAIPREGVDEYADNG